LKDNLITRLFSQTKSKSLATDLADQSLLGWRPAGSTLRHYESNQYENGYASIQAIVKRFWNVIPYAIDENGKPLENQNIINVLARPNRDMSGVDFREALAVMTLVHDRVYIRVHHRGTRLTEQSVEGFTFLEGVTELKIDGKITYRAGTESYTTDEVIVIKNVNPYDLSSGFSAARAATRWTRLDDYIADYQSGFFENGAVPAGQFVITAPTATEYKDIVRNLQAKHRGAGKNNNVTYTYAPIDPVSGKPGQAAITWVPFNNTNKDLDLKNLFEQVNKKIDSTYGVPSSIRGVNDNNTYASVRVDETIFIDQVVRPFATKIWTRFTHELNRMTSGLGYAVTFEIDTPHIAEEEKLEAERKQVEMTLLTTMLDRGFTLGSIVDSFELSTAYKTLKADPNFVAPSAPVAPAIIANDKPEVDNGDEVEDAPAGSKAVTMTKVMSETERTTYEERIGTAVRQFMSDHIEATIKELDVVESKAIGLVSNDMNLAFATSLYDVIIPAMISKGIISQQQGIALLAAQGAAVGQLDPFTLSAEQSALYRQYLKSVAGSYNDDTANSIRATLKAAQEGDLSAYEIKSRLRGIINTDEYRVRRLAITETNRIGGKASVYAMENIQNQTGVRISKVWQTSDGSSPCEYCAGLQGKEVAVEGNFAKQGDSIQGNAGGILVNSFVDMDTADAHPHCKCFTTYRVVR